MAAKFMVLFVCICSACAESQQWQTKMQDCKTALMSGLTADNACTKFGAYSSCMLTGCPEDMQSSAEATIKETKESHPLFSQCFSATPDAKSGSSTHPDANGGSITSPDANSGSDCKTALMSGLTDGNACSKFDTYTSCLSTGHHENMQSSAEATIKEIKASHPLFAQCFSATQDAKSGSSTHPDADRGSGSLPDAKGDTKSSSASPSSSISHPDANSGSSTHPDSLRGSSSKVNALSITRPDANIGSSTTPNAIGESLSGSVFSSSSSFLVAAFIMVGTAI